MSRPEDLTSLIKLGYKVELSRTNTGKLYASTEFREGVPIPRVTVYGTTVMEVLEALTEKLTLELVVFGSPKKIRIRQQSPVDVSCTEIVMDYEVFMSCVDNLKEKEAR